MSVEAIQIPRGVGEAYIDIARWMRGDLVDRGANQESWEGELWYLLPERLGNLWTSEASLQITASGGAHLRIQPMSGGPEVSLGRDELEPAMHWNSTHALLRRVIMREAKGANDAMVRLASRMANEL